MAEPEWLAVWEVASLLRVNDMTVYRWIWNGKLPATKLPNDYGWRVRRSDVAKFADPPK